MISRYSSVSSFDPDAVEAENRLYDRGNRAIAFTGVIFTIVCGAVFAVLAVTVFFISAMPGQYDSIVAMDGQERTISISISYKAHLGISLGLNALVTLCTEAAGFVHATTLKWALAKEGRLVFNANLRLLTSARGIFSSNGFVVNALYSISLILSYAASSTILLTTAFPACSISKSTGLYCDEDASRSVISFVPPALLGTAFLIQGTLALIAFYGTQVPTWSNSPLDVTLASLHRNLTQYRPNRCMRSAAFADSTSTEPIRPAWRQPSIYNSRRSARWIVRLAWLLSAIFAVIGAYVVAFKHGEVFIPWDGIAPPMAILTASLAIGGIQSVLTIGIHCCELIALLARDEVVWRAATTKKGTKPMNPIRTFLGSWHCVVLLIAKPIIHWLFGWAVSAAAGYGIWIRGVLVFYLAAGTVAVAIFTTLVARSRPVGPQPSSYGHVQTLADLVDEWSIRLFWGHKKDRSGAAAHAGTSSRRLPSVNMEEAYAMLLGDRL